MNRAITLTGFPIEFGVGCILKGVGGNVRLGEQSGGVSLGKF